MWINYNRWISSGQTVVLDGATVTLGRCGGAVNLASGATQKVLVNRTGNCAQLQRLPFTATNGSGFFVNTAGGAVTATLPSSPTAGQIVAFSDYSSTFACNNLTIGRAGSKLMVHVTVVYTNKRCIYYISLR